MIKILTVLAVLGPSISTMAASTFTVRCEVRGVVDQPKKWEYKTIISGNFSFDPATLVPVPKDRNGGCKPVSATSQVFGEEGGTRLQIKASKCGSNDMYVTFRTTVNDLPIIGYMNNRLGRVILNEDDPEIGDKPIVVPEGKFKFIYSDCRIE